MLKNKKTILFIFIFFAFFFFPKSIKENFYVKISKDKENLICPSKYQIIESKDYILRSGTNVFCKKELKKENVSISSFNTTMFQSDKKNINIKKNGKEFLNLQKNGETPLFINKRFFLVNPYISKIKEISLNTKKEVFEKNFNSVITSLYFSSDLGFVGLTNGYYYILDKNGKEIFKNKDESIVLASTYKDGDLFFVRALGSISYLFHYKINEKNKIKRKEKVLFKRNLKRNIFLIKTQNFIWLEDKDHFNLYEIKNKRKTKINFKKDFYPFNYVIDKKTQSIIILSKSKNSSDVFMSVFLENGILILQQKLENKFLLIKNFDDKEKIILDNNVYTLEIENRK